MINDKEDKYLYDYLKHLNFMSLSGIGFNQKNIQKSFNDYLDYSISSDLFYGGNQYSLRQVNISPNKQTSVIKNSIRSI